MRKQRGYTLLETVIAIALTLLISAAAISVVLTTVHTSDTLQMAQSSVRESENLLVCCQSENLQQSLRLLYGDDSITLLGDTFVAYFDSSNKYISDAASADAVWKIECERQSSVFIHIRAISLSSDGTDGRLLYEINYTKAQ